MPREPFIKIIFCLGIFISILFTYYGVNFHLTGLHSYASGEASSLAWTWQTALFIAVLGGISYPKYRRFYKK